MSQMQYSSQYLYAYPTSTVSSVPSDGVHGSDTAFTTSTTYDFYTGRPLIMTDANGQQTTNYYTDAATGYTDPLLRPVKVTAPNGQQTVFEYGDTIGNLYVKVKKQIDETNWDEAATFFDGLGRKFKTQTKDSQGDVFVETQYDNMGRVKQVTNPYRSNTNETKLWNRTVYDELGRVTQTFSPVPNPDTQLGYSLGTMEYSLSTVPGQLGTVVTSTDAAERKGRSITNLLGQLIRVDEPSHTGSLDPLATSTPNPNPSPSPTPDPPSGGGGGGGGGCYTESIPNCLENTGTYPMVSTYYKYDALGRMVEVTQGLQKRYFLYDGLGRLLRVKQPEQEANPDLAWNDPVTGNSDWSAGFTYDNLGNVLTATDAKGTVITNTYDNAGRVKTRSYSDEPPGINTPQVDYYYDGLGLSQPANFAKGKLTKVTSSGSETRYTSFDQMGQILSSEQITDGQTYPSSYKYNLSGGLIEQTYPSGEIVRNFIESDGDLSRIAVRGHTYASNFSYTAAGITERLQVGNGRWEWAQFNEQQQATQLALGTSPTDTSLWKLNFEYGEIDVNGNVDTSKNTGNIARQTISFTGLPNSLVQAYKYDSLYRITEAKETSHNQQIWKQAYGYDRYGNRTGFSQDVGGQQLNINNLTLPQIDQNTNRFSANQGYTYDKNGNLIRNAENWQFIFNGDNKQTQVKDFGGNPIGTYYYDGEGKRIKKVTNSETTVFVYDGLGKLIAEYSNQLTQNPTINYIATDPVNSIRAITNKQGEIVSRRDFMPFGEELNSGVGPRNSSLKYSVNGQDAVRKRFTGYEKDSETGLDFAEARYYKNNHGRFTAVDPLLASGKSANPQTFNRYTYVLNGPLQFTDPSGMQVNVENKQINTYTEAGTIHYTSDTTKGVPFNGTVEVDGTDHYRYKVTPSSITAIGVANGIPWFAGWGFSTEDQMLRPGTILSGYGKGVPNFFINSLNSGLNYDFGSPFGIFPNPTSINLSASSMGVPDIPTVRYNNIFEQRASWTMQGGLTITSLAMAAEGLFAKAPATGNAFGTGSFSIIDWSGYPKGYPRPAGPFRLIEGGEYDSARASANSINRNLRNSMGLTDKVQIHEIHPIKFGGSPTDIRNKMIIPANIHRKEFNPFWLRVQKGIK